MNLLRWARKKPHDICAQLAHDLEVLNSTGRAATAKYCSSARKVQDLHAFLSNAPPNDKEVDAVLQVVSETKVMMLLVNAMGKWEFEGRKDIVEFFAACVERRNEVFVAYLCASPLLKMLPNAYIFPETALNCGLMFRDAMKCEEVLTTIWNNEYYVPLFEHVRNSSYDLASDAWLSLKQCIMLQKKVAAAYIENNFDSFFSLYNGLLDPGENETNNYVTLRQALKLLSDMLLDRAFVQTMLKYAQKDEYLKLHMNLLKNPSKTIQFEAFHIFKIFAANPKKPIRVHRILWQNRNKLLGFFDKFLQDQRGDDEQFQQDRSTVEAKLRALEEPPKPQQTCEDTKSPGTESKAPSEGYGKSQCLERALSTDAP
eukprot:GEMP01004068.1.p1 GENE.GEMP01004068.1~~GEMP01004068.1.p1  ORF type:complete len:371 (+),score=86.34 GEMP01004068.1:585-1697(+)